MPDLIIPNKIEPYRDFYILFITNTGDSELNN